MTYHELDGHEIHTTSFGVSVIKAGHDVTISEENGKLVISVYDCCMIEIDKPAKREPTIIIDSDEYQARLVIKETESNWLSVDRQREGIGYQ